MSLPRMIVPGRTYLLTRRCSERRLFLRPSKVITQIVEFCLAMAAQRTGVRIHAHGFLSNHFHIVATDVEGRLPEFMHWLDTYIAKCVNAKLGRWESFWAPGSYSQVRLVDQPALIGELVYTFTNPVESGLVRTAKEWPGALSCPADWERPARVVERPVGFFRENGPVPKTATLSLCAPDSLELTVKEMETLVAEREAELRRDAKAKGLGFMGARRILKQSPFSRPKTSEERRKLNPRVACRDKWRRIEALQRLTNWTASYRDALAAFMAGDRSVRFPYGTYAMRIRFGVLCNGP